MEERNRGGGRRVLVRMYKYGIPLQRVVASMGFVRFRARAVAGDSWSGHFD